ncbi:MAG: acetyl-CoA carboxylase biotin carboxyl carrier protein subunit, partial [Solirubrobacterales bacterium]
PRPERAGGGAAGGGAGETLVSPIQGSVLKVAVSQGDEVEEGTLICIVEAMKMENEITAHRAGKVAELGVAEGGSVAAGDMIARIE